MGGCQQSRLVCVCVFGGGFLPIPCARDICMPIFLALFGFGMYYSVTCKKHLTIFPFGLTVPLRILCGWWLVGRCVYRWLGVCYVTGASQPAVHVHLPLAASLRVLLAREGEVQQRRFFLPQT